MQAESGDDSLYVQAMHQIVGGAKEISVHSPIEFVNKTALDLALLHGASRSRRTARRTAPCWLHESAVV